MICTKERCQKLGYLTRGKDLKRQRAASAQRQRVDEETETQNISPKQVSLLSFNTARLSPRRGTYREQPGIPEYRSQPVPPERERERERETREIH